LKLAREHRTPLHHEDAAMRMMRIFGLLLFAVVGAAQATSSSTNHKGSVDYNGIYLLKGQPVFLYNLLNLERFRWQGEDALAPGKHTIVFDFKSDGPGFGKGGTGVLRVDGKEVANQKIPHTIPFLMTLGETFDIGSDTRTSVDDGDYQVPFAFTGKVENVSVQLN
jgi:hypothetical protein